MRLEDPAETAIASALSDQRMAHEFQPIWELGAGRLAGFEALARFPEAPPDRVWRLALRTGRALAMDVLSCATAFAQAASLPGSLFLNVSAGSLEGLRAGEADPREGIMRVIGGFGPAAGRVVVEITEDTVRDDRQAAAGAARIRDLGLRLAVDDAGSGHSSPRRLRLLRPCLVKVDRSVLAAWRTGQPEALYRWVRRSRMVGAEVVAEGVEEAADAPLLHAAGCAYVQGYAFGRPAPASHWSAETLRDCRPPADPARGVVTPNDPCADGAAETDRAG